jgi:hypothetical protein
VIVFVLSLCLIGFAIFVFPALMSVPRMLRQDRRERPAALERVVESAADCWEREALARIEQLYAQGRLTLKDYEEDVEATLARADVLREQEAKAIAGGADPRSIDAFPVPTTVVSIEGEPRPPAGEGQNAAGCERESEFIRDWERHKVADLLAAIGFSEQQINQMFVDQCVPFSWDELVAKARRAIEEGEKHGD